jgi:hypothetical protein
MSSKWFANYLRGMHIPVTQRTSSHCTSPGLSHKLPTMKECNDSLYVCTVYIYSTVHIYCRRPVYSRPPNSHHHAQERDFIL